MTQTRRSPPEISGKIRAARKARGLTLEQLAQQSGVSKSMLSQIERGQTNPTFATLWNLTQTLGIDIQDLIEGDGEEAAETAIELVPANLIPTISSADGRCLLRILSPAERASHQEWYEMRVQPGGQLRSEPHAAGSREHLTVLQGVLTVECGAARQAVRAGETARYRADLAHCIANAGAETAVALLVVVLED
ncbi:MAG TPA: XRE family transcriptional regulator [Candidatus Competibacteraceae bacterium]|nr:XRE family transcriptional regulator [Candidatus Competibacteraceae bacterium]